MVLHILKIFLYIPIIVVPDRNSHKIVNICMILNKLKYKKDGTIKKCQEVTIKCDICGESYKRRLDDLYKNLNFDIRGIYKCRNCTSEIPASLEYNGPEIITKLKRNKRGIVITTQYIDVKCSKCKLIKNVLYSTHKRNSLKRIGNYICIKCIGINNCINNANNQFGKTYEELYGIKKSKEIKAKLQYFNLNERVYNPESYIKGRLCKNKGKTWEEIFGKDRAIELKKQHSFNNSGKNNPMYGRPTPNGSGNGWSGWYKGWFFRSLLELSFMINYIEKNNIQWISAESKKYTIKYKNYNGNDRTYRADFILENNILVEIKPNKLLKTLSVQLKQNAAEKWCISHNMKYKIFSEKDFDKLKKCDIIELYKNGNIIFTDRYKEKIKEIITCV